MSYNAWLDFRAAATFTRCVSVLLTNSSARPLPMFDDHHVDNLSRADTDNTDAGDEIMGAAITSTILLLKNECIHKVEIQLVRVRFLPELSLVIVWQF